MAGYEERHVDVDGVDTVVLAAGEGPPLVFLHGAGTTTGFDALLPLAERFRLVVPFHPGYGRSADDPTLATVHDYVRHYLDLFDALELDEFALAGHSLGGCFAASFAIGQPRRVTRLVLAAPFGLKVPAHPTVDLFSLRDEEVLGRLSAERSVFEGHVPVPPTPEFLAARYREATSTARLYWAHPYEPSLPRWLHRLTMPTLLLWGDADRLIPVEQAPIWAERLPHAEIRTLPGVGHLLFDETRAAVDALGEFAASSA